MAKYLVFKEDVYVGNTPSPYSKHINPGEKFMVTDETSYTYTFERLGKKLTAIKSSEGKMYSIVVNDEADTTADKDIIPRKAWNEERMNDLRTAIRCALDAGREIPAEWVEELNDLLSGLIRG